MRMTSLSRVSSWIAGCAAGLLMFGVVDAAAQRSGQRSGRPAPPPPAPAPNPQVSVVGIRVVGVGLGANGSELRAFNERPGTAIAIAIQAPTGTGIVGIDDHASKLDAFSDDKGQSLLEEGRIGPFPKVAEDGSSALVEVEVQARPSSGAVSVTAQGSVTMTLANGSKPQRIANVRLEATRTLKLGNATITITEAKADDESTQLTFGLARSVLTTLRGVRFLDAKNEAIESHRRGSGYINEKAELEYELKTKDKVVSVEFDVWQSLRSAKVPFNVQAGLGFAPGGRPAAAAAASGAASGQGRGEPPADKPPPTITAADGAESVDAVVKRMQTAAAAQKPADILSVIYPDDRVAYARVVGMVLAFLPMSHMDDAKAGEKLQKDLDDLFARNKLKMPLSRDDVFKDVDLPAFLADAMKVFKSQVKKGDDPAGDFPVPKGRPQSVKITGDSAVAQLEGKDVKFTKIGTKWFIRLE